MSEIFQSGELVVPLAAEELEISRRKVAGDTVRVRTVTTVHDQLVDEALAQETVEVTRIAKGHEIEAAPEIIQDGDLTIVPVVEEILVLQRKLILKEEVHIRRIHSVVQHRETVPLRRQDAVIERIPRPEEETFLNPQPKEPT